MTVKDFLIENDCINKVVELQGIKDNFSKISVASCFNEKILLSEVLTYKKKNTKKTKRYIIVFNGSIFN